MRCLAILLIAALGAAFGLPAQNLSRRAPARARSARKAAPTLPAPDTLRAPWTDSVAVAGFEKPLRAVKETMFVTNASSLPIEGLGIEITYTDMQGRMLHKAVHPVACDLPAGETRRIEVPSFDRSGLLYYRLSPVPARATRATPFDASVRVLYLLISNPQFPIP